MYIGARALLDIFLIWFGFIARLSQKGGSILLVLIISAFAAPRGGGKSAPCGLPSAIYLAPSASRTPPACQCPLGTCHRPIQFSGHWKRWALKNLDFIGPRNVNERSGSLIPHSSWLPGVRPRPRLPMHPDSPPSSLPLPVVPPPPESRISHKVDEP